MIVLELYCVLKNLYVKRLRYMDIFFVLQDLLVKYNDNFFVNLFGVWVVSIFVELYEENSFLYVCMIIYRKV